MADPRKFELDDILVRPGTYFNPQTEVLIVVDDSPEMGAEVFNMEEFEGAEWVLISDDAPMDENQRDEKFCGQCKRQTKESRNRREKT